MDCKSIDPEIVLTVRFYRTPAGFCWYPVRDGLEGDDVMVGTHPQIVKRIKELNIKHGIEAVGTQNPIRFLDP